MGSRRQQSLVFAGFVLAILVGEVALGSRAYGQATMPDGWESLPAAEFVTAVKQAREQEGGVHSELQSALEENAASRLLDAKTTAEESYEVLLALLRISGDVLSEEERDALSQQMQQRTDRAGSLSLEELKSRYEMVVYAQWKESNANARAAAAEVVEWIASNSEIEQLEPQELAWLLEHLCLPKHGVCSFKARWDGTITPPRDGEYVFSVSPHNINWKEHPYNYDQASTVTVGGRKLVEATPNSWVYKGGPVQLTAGQPVNLSVDFSYQCDMDTLPTANSPIQVERSPYAVLKWEGPGVTESVVPASVLTLPAGNGNGLQAEYEITNREANYVKTVVSIVEPQIDHTWIGGRAFVAEHLEIQEQVRDALFSKVMDAEYWLEASSEGEGSQTDSEWPFTHLLIQELPLAAFLTASQRQQFLEELTARPELLEQLSNENVYRVYTRYRFGNEDAALDLLKAWMVLRKDTNPQMSLTPKAFYFDHRHVFRMLALMMPGEYPEKFVMLRDNLLELEDGSCCLPVAYVIANGYLTHEKDSMPPIAEWIEFLDEKLKSDGLEGDLRVNWLLARAMAQEYRKATHNIPHVSLGDLSAARPWIDEASLVAEDPATSWRVAKELIARLAAQKKRGAASDAIDRAANQASDSTILQEINLWRTQLEKLQVQAEKNLEAERLHSEQTLAAELQRRYQMALKSQNPTEIARYQDVVESLEAEE